MADAQSIILTDARGRQLTVKPLSVLEQARTLRAIGPAQASNQPYMELVFAACMVQAIDGIPMVRPQSEMQIDAAFNYIGDDGMAAVVNYLKQDIDAAMEAARSALMAGGAPPPGPLTQPGSSPGTGPSESSSTS